MSPGDLRLRWVATLGGLALCLAGGGCGDPPPSDVGDDEDLAMAAEDLAPDRSDLAAPARCDDGVKNGLESDVDCGGPLCDKCENLKRCDSVFDCKSGLCTNGRCTGPSC